MSTTAVPGQLRTRWHPIALRTDARASTRTSRSRWAGEARRRAALLQDEATL